MSTALRTEAPTMNTAATPGQRSFAKYVSIPIARAKTIAAMK